MREKIYYYRKIRDKDLWIFIYIFHILIIIDNNLNLKFSYLKLLFNLNSKVFNINLLLLFNIFILLCCQKSIANLKFLINLMNQKIYIFRFKLS